MTKTRTSRTAFEPVLLGCVLLVTAATSGSGQHSPYADFTDREIKALSQDEVADYLSGAGMGLALAAELNGYPGPRHVLELADELELDEPLLSRTREVFAAMQEAAVRLGTEIVERERHLDRLFAEARISEPELVDAVAEIARLRGDLRVAHLRAHLEMVKILTPGQVEAYRRLRGYAAGHHHGHHAHPDH